MNKLDKIEEMYKVVVRKCNVLSNARLLAAVTGLVSLIISIKENNHFSSVCFVISSVAFIILLAFHDKLQYKKEYYKANLEVYTRNLSRKDNTWYKFKDTGNDYLDKNKAVEKDLDIFGENSLFQYMCTARTTKGRHILASYLKNENFDEVQVVKRQKAVKELIEREDISHELETLSLMIGVHSENKQEDWYREFISYLKVDKKLISGTLCKIALILPVFTVVLCIFSVQGKFKFIYAGILLLIQLLFGYFVNIRNKNVVGNIYKFCYNMNHYYNYILYIQKVDFESAYLKELTKTVKLNNLATRGMEKLDILNNAFSIQRNPYIHIVLQMLFIYDVQCIIALERWKKEYKDSIQNLFSIIGEFEALVSLATIGCKEMVCFPEFVKEEEVSINAKELYHPLIDSKKAVANSFQVQKETTIITGSNMSGKSTFMRTVGINCILAYAGAPVCAKSMKLSYMKVLTSMRVQDDVSKGISSFYAEVLEIKEIVEFSHKCYPMLVLIDEIFKGTNSADRIVGAKAILKALNKKNVNALITTHDFELCELIENNEIVGKNYHFEEFYGKDEIKFDYKIKGGRCKTTNAKQILRMAGLLD